MYDVIHSFKNFYSCFNSVLGLPLQILVSKYTIYIVVEQLTWVMMLFL